VSKDEESQTGPVVIKKYANRRLYNTDTSSYVTLDDLAEMVRAERDFNVHDAKTGEDLTHAVLTQIIVEQESKGQNLLPIRFLRQLIRFYGDSIERIVPSYLEFSLDSLTREQDKYRKQFAGAFAAPPFEAMQEHAKQNMAMFEKALGMFNPYTGAGSEDAGNQQSKPNASNASEAPGDAGGTEESSGELETLKAEMSAMQDKLDQISKRSS
jgi:polyhydroxyalkanoate synthesis repressor PhaR